jgi:hypothetical protein
MGSGSRQAVRSNGSVASVWCSWPPKWKCPAIICTLLYFGQETVSLIWHSLTFCSCTSRLSLTLSCCRLLAQWKFQLRPDAHSSFNRITEQNLFPTHSLSISVVATSLTSIIHNRWLFAVMPYSYKHWADVLFHLSTLMHNSFIIPALKLVNEISLYYDAGSKNIKLSWCFNSAQLKFICSGDPGTVLL